jgi:hypothetical protein
MSTSEELRGAVLWEGPTCLPNGGSGRIAAIATGIAASATTKNRKTGRGVVQVWYIPTDQGPLIGAGGVVLSGRDQAVCGNCKHRPATGGACYVNIGRGPQRIWYTYQRGGYPKPSLPVLQEVLHGRTVRFGAYGEPPSIPLHVYTELLPVLGAWQGYTHAWENLEASAWGFLMASVDTRLEGLVARAKGWRTFRVRRQGEPLDSGERVCPAAEEAGHLLTCAKCRQCDGSWTHPDRPSRVIVSHGFRAARFADTARQVRLFAKNLIGEKP